MHHDRTGRWTSACAAALACAISMCGSARAQSHSAPAPGETPNSIENYWTAERKQNATPLMLRAPLDSNRESPGATPPDIGGNSVGERGEPPAVGAGSPPEITEPVAGRSGRTYQTR